MNCRQICDKLPEYIEGDLSDLEIKEIKEHLSACPTCSAELFVYERTWNALGAWEDVELPVSFVPELVKKLEKPSLLAKIATIFTFKIPAWSAMALAVIFITAGAVHIVSEKSQPAPLQSTVVQTYKYDPAEDDIEVAQEASPNFEISDVEDQVLNPATDELLADAEEPGSPDISPAAQLMMEPSINRADTDEVFDSQKSMD